MKKFIYYPVFATILFLSMENVHGQGMLAPLQSLGTPFVTPQQYVELKGTPYLYEDWTEGVLFASNGNEYSKIQLKFDLITDELLFQEKTKGQSYAVNTPIDSFAFVSEGREHYFVLKEDGKFYERLFKGADVALYKRISKNLTENRPYMSADVTATIRERTYYFVEKKGKMERMQANRRSVLGLASGKDKAALEAFLKKSNVNPGTEEGLVSAVAFLNENAGI